MSDPLNVRAITKCRLCGHEKLSEVVALGDQCVSGIFQMLDDAPAVPIPLTLVRCDGGCGLVQLQHSVPPEAMYKHYWYRSGVNQTMRDHLAGIAREAEALAGLQAGDMVLDIGCNDGTLLEWYTTPDIRRMGMDPATNVIQLALKKGIPVVCDFFSAERYHTMMSQKPKVITSIAMFYDLEDPQAFVRDIAAILHADGIWILELSYLPTMLAQNSFDTVCHEHLEYYHLAPLERLLEQHGLTLLDVTLNGMNGGSFRATVGHTGRRAPSGDAPARMDQLRWDEFMGLLDQDEGFLSFRLNIERIRGDMIMFLKGAKAAGKVVHGYGASTKGNTILQYCGVTPELLPAIADRNPDKWLCRTVGTGIWIISEEASRALKPDYYLALPWHFMPEFREREKEFLARGGRFVVPMPHLRVE